MIQQAHVHVVALDQGVDESLTVASDSPSALNGGRDVDAHARRPRDR